MTEETPQEELKRAHNEDGTFKGDDPATPEVNEAYDPPKPTLKPRNVLRKERVGAPTVGARRVKVGGFSSHVKVINH